MKSSNEERSWDGPHLNYVVKLTIRQCLQLMHASKIEGRVNDEKFALYVKTEEIPALGDILSKLKPQPF
jgi:hypothetical protein